MKMWLGTLGFLVSTSVFAIAQFPEGNSVGGGSWKDGAGKSGEYKVEMQIKGNTIRSVYQWEKKEEVFTFHADFKPNGFFAVKMGKDVVGEGYCGDVQCHYNVAVGPFRLEETLTFREGNIYRLGSKVVDGHQIVWQEALETK